MNSVMLNKVSRILCGMKPSGFQYMFPFHKFSFGDTLLRFIPLCLGIVLHIYFIFEIFY